MIKLPKEAARIIDKTIWRNEDGEAYFLFLHSLGKCYSPKMIIECGTEFGLSTIAFASAISGFVHTIDLNQRKDTKEILGNYPNIVFHRGDVIEIGENILKRNDPEFVYLDAEHSTQGIIREFEVFSASPVILIHDTYPNDRADIAISFLEAKYPEKKYFTFKFLKGFTLWTEPK
jgi:cephalosporin hydroxylase